MEHLFPGGRGRLRLVQAEQALRPVVGGEPCPTPPLPTRRTSPSRRRPEDEQPEAGVEIEVTPPGKSTKRLSLLSGGEKSLVALAFMFAVFLARPCPFYILDEVEAALDDINIDRFLQLVKGYSDRAQFIVVTHQKRTMDAADTLYGVSMGGDGISRVVSRKLAGRAAAEDSHPPQPTRPRRGRLYPPRAHGPHLARAVPDGRGPAARRRPRGRARAPRLLPAPAREHVEDAPGPRCRAPGHRVPVARRRGVRAPRGDADLRRRRRPHHGGDRRAARARGGDRRAAGRRGPSHGGCRSSWPRPLVWTATPSLSRSIPP